MQGKNSTRQRPPRPGDGTQPATHDRPEANWFGTSQEPQEEYVENDPANPERADTHAMSEGEPTFGHKKRDSEKE